MTDVEVGMLLQRFSDRLAAIEASVNVLLAAPSLEPRILAMEADIAEAAADLAALAADRREAAVEPEPEPEAEAEPEVEVAPEPEVEPAADVVEEPEPEVTPMRVHFLHRKIGRGA